ncbi:MAG: type II toxin-antitoxin system VapB family antitoxin [Candidatus Omnitrophica bacterium]|nr:type II toxin-antitoxin system VapB family antitoxin [Candidatus Omnitrophota bacterium]
MKITTYIDERLLKRAVRASRAKTKREVLENGLRSLLAEIQRNTFVSEFDHLRLRTSPEELARLRA